jgi:hypothetical protein
MSRVMTDDFELALVQARTKLAPPQGRDPRPLRALAAAAFFAFSALTFAACAVLAPANEHTPAARAGVQ